MLKVSTVIKIKIRTSNRNYDKILVLNNKMVTWHSGTLEYDYWPDFVRNERIPAMTSVTVFPM